MLALFATLLVLAPALDFLPPHLVPSQYAPAVRAIADAAVCIPPAERPQRSQSNADRPGGDTLVRPAEQRRVSVVVGYELHFHAATRLSFGGEVDSEKRIPSDAVCAARLAVELDSRGQLVQLRTRASTLIRTLDGELRPHSLRLNKLLMPDNVFRIARNMNVLLFAAIVDGLQLRDRDAPRCFWHGFRALGELPDTGAHRALSPISPSERADFRGKFALVMATNEQWHDELERMVIRRNTKPNPSADEAARRDAVIATTAKELDKGLVSPAMSRHQLIKRFGYGQCRAMLRSAIFQKDKWRCIDDGRRSLGNDATLPVETIVTTSFEFALHVARVGYSTSVLLRKQPVYWQLGLDDLQSAFRTIPTSQPQFNVFAVWSPAERAVRYHYTYGFVFGLKSSVTQFNRYPEVMVTAARCLAAVPAHHFFDDYMVSDPSSAGSSGQDFVFDLHRYVGDGLSFDEPRRFISAPAIEPAKRQPMAPSNVALGVTVDLAESGGEAGAVVFRPSPDRVEHCLELWRRARDAGRLEPHEAGVLRGKQNFLLEAAQGQVGRAASLVLVQREHHDDDYGWTPELEHAYEFYAALLPNLPVRRASVAPPRMQPLLVYTDASFRPRKRKLRDPECSEFKRRYVARLGVVLYDPHCDPQHGAYDPQLVGGCDSGFLLYGSAVPTDEVTATFARTDDGDPLKTYIAQCEVVAAVSVYYTFADKVRGRQVNHFIDNTVALSGMVHGYARKLDLARMVNAYHLQLAGLKTDAYLEFVPSLANLADLPSRDEYEVLKRLGGRAVPIRVPPAADWIAPLNSWLAAHGPSAQ